jgi:quinol monooxygenase YgiN
MGAAGDGSYVVVVEFRVKEEQASEFTRLLLENAEASRSLEPGCLIFDVCRWPDDHGRFLLYEIYTEKAAFQEHLESSHFKAFDEAVRSWVVEKKVHILDRLGLLADPGASGGPR